jgi:hypothetical protein
MTRYRFLEAFGGATTANQQQHQVALAGDFHLDARQRFSIRAGVYTGSSFTGGWDTTGPGTGAPRANLYLKQLFLRVAPWAGLEARYGGLGFVRGESSEITSYDADGFLVGQRLTLRRPRQAYFDEVSVTLGYVGDLNRASVFRRLGGLARVNYRQILVAKQLSRRLRVSADYSSEAGQGTYRQAVTFAVPRLRVADLIRFEQYERDGPAAGYGFGVFGEKRIRRLTAGAGYSSLDRRGLYADRFSQGQYAFANLHYAFSPVWSMSAQATRGITSASSSAPRTRLDIAIGYNLRPALTGSRRL